MSDGSTKDVAVTWDNTSVDTSKAGTYTYTGTVEGYSEKAKLTLNIAAKQVDFKLWPSKQNVDINKTFIIYFNYDLDKSTVNNDNIYIEDSNGNRANIVIIYNNGSSINIALSTPFLHNQNYCLYVNDKLKSSRGEYIKQAVKMNFSTN